MPWCDPCGRFYSPNTLTPEGYCPSKHFVADQPDGELAAKRDSASASGEVPADAGLSGKELSGLGSPGEPPFAINTLRSKTSSGSARTKVPWHFWLLLAALTIYLGWRFVQLVGWLIN